MSKRVEAKITCPNCDHQFDFTLYRSIWGEYSENREELRLLLSIIVWVIIWSIIWSITCKNK